MNPAPSVAGEKIKLFLTATPKTMHSGQVADLPCQREVNFFSSMCSLLSSLSKATGLQAKFTPSRSLVRPVIMVPILKAVYFLVLSIFYISFISVHKKYL